MKLLTRYLAREVYASVALVLSALLVLFAFLDLIHELGRMGSGDYNLGYVLLFVFLTLPSHIYNLFPLAILIGTIVALVQMAAHSELVVYRASGASLGQMVWALCKIGLPLVVLSYVCAELVAPPSERMAQSMRLQAQKSEVKLKEFRSGVWVKDERSFVNVKNVLPDTSLLNISIYDFDESYHLRTITAAKRAVFVGENEWRLEEVEQTRFSSKGVEAGKLSSMPWHSVLNPSLLSVLLVVPEQMSAWNLYQYTEHLRSNHQKGSRYEIAMWNKLLYPFAVLVMMLLALPFASHHRREGGVGAKVFIGIVLGLSFHFAGRLFASLGAINDWQPLLSAAAMPLLYLTLAGGMLWWTERR